MLLVPEPHGGRSTVTTTLDEVRGRRSAMPLGAGEGAMLTIRKRRRGRLPPEVFGYVKRRSTVPNVEFWAGLDVLSRTRLGAAPGMEHESRVVTTSEEPLLIGDDRFSGPGAPRR